jgi:catechol 2,3-dioxygenase-like lactoylglutathione lyase family enzyme
MSGPVEKNNLDTMDHVAVSVADVGETVNWYKQHFQCKVAYQDDTWALVEFANIRLAFVLPSQHPDHFAVLGDPRAYGQPKKHRDGTSSVYIQDPNGNNVEILALADIPAKHTT